MADEEQSLKVKIKIEGDTTGAKQTEEALKGVKQQAGGVAEGATKAAASTKEMGKEVKEMGKLSHELEGVLAGLERGGIGGLASAARNAGKAIGVLATSTIGAVLIPIIAGATAAILIMNKAAESNREQMKKTFEENAKAAELYAKKVEELKKVTEKQFSEMTKEVEKHAAAYKDVVAAIDAAEKRVEQMNKAKQGLAKTAIDVEEKQALAKATTPEQEASIKRDFQTKRELKDIGDKRNEAEGKVTQGFVDKKAAQEAIAQAAQDQRDAEALVREKKRDFETAQSTAETLSKKDPTGKAAVDARKKALALRGDLQEAEKKSTEVIAKASDQIKEAQQKIDSADINIAIAKIDSQAIALALKGMLADLQIGAKEGLAKEKEAAGAVASTETELKKAKDDAFAQSGLTKDTPKVQALTGELAKVTAAHEKTASVVTDYAKGAQKTASKIVTEIKTLKEQSGGR